MPEFSRGIVILYEDLCERWVPLLSEASLTSLGVHKIALPGSGSVGSLLAELEADGGRDIINKIEASGVEVQYELHALEWLLPRGLFADLPEYFRTGSNGKRTNDLNLCPSSGGATETVSENALALARRLRQTSPRYFLWPDDAVGGRCHCDKCRGKNGADQALLTAEAVLRGLRVYDSRASLSFLAYADMMELPSVAPPEGIFLEFAPMNRNHAAPINAPGDAGAEGYAALLPRLLEIFRPEKAHVLEYWLYDALYSGYRMPPVKVPFLPGVAEADVSFYAGLGIRNIKTFASFIGGEYFKLHGAPPIKRYGEILKKYIH